MSRPLEAPAGVERHGLSRDEAAFLIGVGATFFDQLVAQGLMPRPRQLGRRKIWVRDEVLMRLRGLPAEGDTPGDSWSDA